MRLSDTLDAMSGDLTSNDLVELERSGDSAIVRLVRPEKHNVLNHDLVRQATAVLQETAKDRDVAVVVVTGAGERAFCAGADIRFMLDEEPTKVKRFLQDTRKLFRTLADLPQPTIAAVNGHAHGGGAELACACDLRVGCDKTTFCFPGVRYGMAVGTWHLPSIVGLPRAKELLYTAATVESDEAYRMGLLNRVTEQNQLLDASLELAGAIAEHPTEAVRSIKTLLDRTVGAPLIQRFYRELYSNQDRGVASGVAERFRRFLER